MVDVDTFPLESWSGTKAAGGSDVVERAPDTEESRRPFELHPTSIAAINSRAAVRVEESLGFRQQRANNSFVFAHEGGESYRAQLFGSTSAPERGTRGLPIVNPRASRHGYATTSPESVPLNVEFAQLDASLIAITGCWFFTSTAR
ncbi:MAG TPA: hypothetical protein VKR27_01565 [Acidimicrobiales bacterium]|nr:hypothetical protein [Acidimicrobiales bacterium]